MNSKTLSILAAAALCTAATSAIADSVVPDRHTAIVELDATAQELTQSLGAGPRVGALDRHEARQQLASIEEERARLAAGGSVNPERLASLAGETVPVDVSDPAVVTASLNDRHDVVERRMHRVGPRQGAIERTEIREELASLDALISDLEQGREVDLDRVDELIGLMAANEPSTPEGQREQLEIQRASDLRQLHSKVGARDRTRLRHEIDDIDRSIGRLDAEI